jgi:hypothetical protein
MLATEPALARMLEVMFWRAITLHVGVVLSASYRAENQVVCAGTKRAAGSAS